MKNELLIFTRYPKPGTTKTRLIPALGDNGAAKMHRRMAEQTVAMAKTLAANDECSLTILYQGSSLTSIKRWLGPLCYREQFQGDLGQRLNDAFKESFDSQNSPAIAIGTDCPDLTPEIIRTAFAALSKADLVVGPAHDGGYYLIGMNRLHAELFTGIDWGTGNVLSQTTQKAKENNLTSIMLEPLHDIDRPEDIKHFSYHSNPE